MSEPIPTPDEPIRLSGDDARRFIRQIEHGRPTAAARKSLAEGRRILFDILAKGYSTIQLDDRS